MADIKHRPIVNHLRANPTSHIYHLSRGKTAHSSAGTSFWFRPGTAAISEVPLDDRDQSLQFRARTRDFQDVSIQATVSYRVADPVTAAGRIDFGIDPQTGLWNSAPLEALSGLLTELAQQPALEVVSELSLQEALGEGIAPVRRRMMEAMSSDERLSERGLDVNDVRVVAIRADAELERSLQAETREAVQQEADRATFERRAMAVQRERAIAENELENQIELAKREQDLVVQWGANEHREQVEKAAAARVAADSAAEAAGETLDLYKELDRDLIVSLAIKELAANLPQIDRLTITPDTLGSALAAAIGAAQEES